MSTFMDLLLKADVKVFALPTAEVRIKRFTKIFGKDATLTVRAIPFETIEEMNETIIKNWNAKVTGADTVFIVGDMFFRFKDVESILRRLNGKKHLIIGNHDGTWLNDYYAYKYFAEVTDFSRKRIEPNKVYE